MKAALCKGDNIEIRGLGAFHVKNYQGYNGRNPKTGEVIPVKPKRGILFRTGKELRDRVNRAHLPRSSSPWRRPSPRPAPPKAAPLFAFSAQRPAGPARETGPDHVRTTR